jgi:hypothetical protein
MADNQIVTPYDDNGWAVNARVTAPITLGGTQVVKGGPGRLAKVTVTTVLAVAATVIYDNASAASGTPLLTIPSATAAGTVYDVSLPAANGITVASGSGTGAITVGYS